MYKTLTAILLLGSSINASFYTNHAKRINSNSNLEDLLPKETKTVTTQENSDFKKIYNEYFINYVKKTYWTEQEALETLDAFEPGVVIITESNYKKRLFVDGFGKGKYDGIIDLYSEKNMVLEADGLEKDYKEYFGEGLSNTENYFLEDLDYFQQYLLNLLESQTEPKKISSKENDKDLDEQEYLLKINAHLILLSPNTMTVCYEDKVTYVNYNPFWISEIHEKIYSTVESINNQYN